MCGLIQLIVGGSPIPSAHWNVHQLQLIVRSAPVVPCVRALRQPPSRPVFLTGTRFRVVWRLRGERLFSVGHQCRLEPRSQLGVTVGLLPAVSRARRNPSCVQEPDIRIRVHRVQLRGLWNSVSHCVGPCATFR